MRKNATEIKLTDKQRKLLEKLSKGTHIELHYKIRATIILYAADDISNRRISKDMNVTKAMVKKWRDRWWKAEKLLLKIEEENTSKLFEEIKRILSDEHRSGKPPVFTPEQIACIIDLSLQTPESVDIPMTHWTLDALTNKVIDLEIVESISRSQVRRFLKRSQI